VPVVVVIVDTPERIEAFLPTVDELVADGLMVRQPVDMIIYRGGKAR
jgi:PII-like signaling protein